MRKLNIFKYVTVVANRSTKAALCGGSAQGEFIYSLNLAKPKAKQIETSDWYWATTLPKAIVSTDTICRIGHKRWEIENQHKGSMFWSITTAWTIASNITPPPLWLLPWSVVSPIRCFRCFIIAILKSHYLTEGPYNL